MIQNYGVFHIGLSSDSVLLHPKCNFKAYKETVSSIRTVTPKAELRAEACRLFNGTLNFRVLNMYGYSEFQTEFETNFGITLQPGI
jgi:hypothetical protein